LNNFAQRTLTAFIFAVVLILCICISSYTFGAIFFIISLLGLWEFFTLVTKDHLNPQKIYGVLIGVYIYCANFLYANGLASTKVILFIIPLVSFAFILELYRKHPKPYSNLAYTFFGLIYITLPFSLLNYLIHSNSGGEFVYSFVLGLLLLIWINDTGAYLSGSQFGKHKLFERISPKKTWEGSIGGAIFTLIASYVISLFFKEIGFAHWLAISVLVVIFGTFGDLAESLFKRGIAIKDSGTILPGHGGILDRFDSVLMASPVVFVYLKIFDII